MEGQDALANGGATPDSPSFGDTLVGGQGVLSLVAGHDKRNGNLADEVLEDLEEYWEGIHDRLMISRMVSDSLIKGMVTAKEQEAAQTITAKELELANLKDLLLSNCARCSCLPGMQPGKTEILRQELPSLKNLGVEQLINIKKEIEFAWRKIEPDSNGVRRGGDLSEKQPEKWVHMDELLGNLEKTFDVICTKADGVFLSCCALQEERDLRANVEGIVIETVLMKFKEEFEDKLLTRNNSQLSRIQSMDWLGKFQELSKLGTQLDAILKSLSIHDSGLVSHGTHDLDDLHHKTLNNHVRVRMSPSGENGTLDAANVHVAEIYDFQQLKHLSKEGLVDYFNDIIIKMKRDHESVLHQRTEEYFCLKREYLKERSSSVTHRKDEEFDVLRRKIPEVISKFEDFLVENEWFPALASTSESIEKMEHRLESLLSENHQLRDHLTDKEKEVKHLEEQAADAAAHLLHSLSKEATLQLVKNLNSAMEELQIEALLKEEVFKCALREQIAETRSDWEFSHMEFLFTKEIYDIILRGAIILAETNDKYESEDSDVKALISNGFCELMCAEAIKDAEQKLNDLTQEILKNKDVISCLEVKALEKENELRQVVEEKENLKQEILDLGTTLGQKEKLASDLSSSLSKKREQLELASQELDNLRQHASQQQTLITESNQELQSLRSEHLEALEQIQIVKLEMHKLNQMLDESKELLEEANQQRNIAFSHTQEMHEKLHSVEAREEKLKKEMEVAVGGFSKMFDDFEFCVSQAVIKNSSRLEDTRSHLKALNGMASALKRTERMYEQRLERRFTDLQMAEVEVDLLGDEVGALLRLLEKIYVALDHYSPVLKHYPGIIEILKLVRRELTGESTKI